MEIGSATPSTNASDPRNLANSDSFMKLLATQLANQDPLSPMENQEFVAQLAQFTSLEETQAMNKSMGELLSLQRLTQAGGLIGRQVEFLTPGGELESGRIDAVSLSGDDVSFSVDGQRVHPDMLVRVLAEQQT